MAEMLSCKIVMLILIWHADITQEENVSTHITLIRKCSKNQRLAIDIKNIRIVNLVSRDFINLTLVAKADLFTKQDHPLIRMNLEKCNSRDALDTCAYLMDFKSSKLCEMISKLNGIKQFLECCTPRVEKCPILKGVYVCENCAFDLHNIPFISLLGSYWKAVTKLYSRNEMVFCIYSEGYLQRIRF